MKDQFDFDKIGKRQPYAVPEGFFEKLQEDVIREVRAEHPAQLVQPEKKVRKKWLVWLAPLSTVAAAAIIALVVMPHRSLQQAAQQDYSYARVEQVFDNPNDADRDFLVSTYQDDPFFNQ